MVDLPEIQEATDVYVAFMQEIKTRLEAIKETVDWLKVHHQEPKSYFRAEFGFLQLRYVCDLVALSILAAHKPFGLDDELLKSWHARRALQDLKAINEDGFPRPVKITRNGGSIQFVLSDDALTRDGLQRIFDKCGRMLHRGIIKHVFEGQAKQYDVNALDRWAAKIGALLSHHALLIPEQGTAFIVNLATQPDGDVSIAIVQSDGPFVYVPQPKTPQPPPPAKPHRQRVRKKHAKRT
jgi:hypothetical protein